jgi:hypothetical protein
MTIHDILAHPNDERTLPLHLIVHPEMPWEEAGHSLLHARAEAAAALNRTELHPHEIAECWRDVFKAEIDRVLMEHAGSTAIIRDPHSTKAAPIHGPVEVSSFDVGTAYQTGFLPPQSLASVIERFGYVTPTTNVRVHGTSFGSCPTGTAYQMAAAAVYGAYLPDDAGRSDVHAHRDALMQAMGMVNALRLETGIRMGTLLDYTGMHEFLESHPHVAGIFRIFDTHTRIIPDRNDALMHGLDVRK